MFFIVGIGFSKVWREEIVLTVVLYNKKYIYRVFNEDFFMECTLNVLYRIDL